MRVWAAILALLFAACSSQCACTDPAEVGDDDVQADDDVMGDDDSGNGQQQFEWAYQEIDIRFEATGGVGGGPSTIRVMATFFGEQDELICEQEIMLQGDYTYGIEQSDELFRYTDELIVPVAAEETADDCPGDLDVSVERLQDLWEWSLFPLAFVSCEAVGADPELAAMQLYPPDPFDELLDGTFGAVCDHLGPAVSYLYETGVHEAVWLRPCNHGEFDELAGLSLHYLEPADTTNTKAWALAGLSAVEAGDTVEPVEGLDGAYQVIPFWPVILASDG